MGIHSSSSNNKNKKINQQSEVKHTEKKANFSLEGPKCQSNLCTSILFITKLDIINMTLDFKCDNCYRTDEKNYPFYKFLMEGYISNNVNEMSEVCKLHNKPYTYFCKTCFKNNCDDCYDKIKYPNHKFFDLSKNKMKKKKIDELNSRIVEEINFLNKLLSAKFKFEKYKNKIHLEELFLNKIFERIFIINIKEKINMVEFKKLLVDDYIYAPNNFLNLQNANYMYQLDKIDEEKLCEELINSSLDILKKYKKQYLFKYMEIKTYKYEIKNRTENLYSDYYLFRYYNHIPFIQIENTDLVIFIDFNIICINIKTGELIYHISDLNYYKNNYYRYCSLEKNIFLIFNEYSIYKYEISENTIKKEDIYLDKYDKNHFINEIKYIFKIFNEHYLLINNYIYYEKELNRYERILEIKDDVYGLLQADCLRNPNEEYFIGNNISDKCFLIKVYIDKNNNSINYSIERLHLDFSFLYYNFINDTNILFHCGHSDYRTFVIYDLKNRNIVCKIQGKEYIKTLNDVLPKIKGIYKSIKLKYYSKSDFPLGYDEIYPLKTKEGEYFISKNDKSNKYEFKIFKYDI